jgi:hypothetical protein
MSNTEKILKEAHTYVPFVLQCKNFRGIHLQISSPFSRNALYVSHRRNFAFLPIMTFMYSRFFLLIGGVCVWEREGTVVLIMHELNRL